MSLRYVRQRGMYTVFNNVLVIVAALWFRRSVWVTLRGAVRWWSRLFVHAVQVGWILAGHKYFDFRPVMRATVQRWCEEHASRK